MKTTPLKNLADFNPRGPVAGQFHSEDLLDFVPMASIGIDGSMQVRERRPYNAVAKGFTAFKAADLLIAKITPCFENNKIAIAEIESEYGFGSTEFHVVRCNQDELLPRYLLHFLRQDKVRLEGERRMTGSAGQKRVPKQFFEELYVPLPSLMEQRRIVAILDKADAICRKREELRKLADLAIRSSFLEIFGDASKCKMDWPVEALEKQASVQVGFPFQSQRYTNSGVRLCRGANVLPGRLDWNDVRFWPSNEGSDLKNVELQEGDVILALDRPWISSGLKVASVRKSDLPALLVQRVARVRGRNESHTRFIYEALRHPAFWSYCRPTETTIPHISPVELRNYPLVKPDERALSKFGIIAQHIQHMIGSLEVGAKDESSLFSSLSQRAFCGEL